MKTVRGRYWQGKHQTAPKSRDIRLKRNGEAKKPRSKGAKPLKRKHTYQGGQDDATKKEDGDCVWVLYEVAKEEGEEKSSGKLDVSIF